MILTMLAVKGIMSIFATKIGAILTVKAALAYGIGATITGLLVAGIVVGGIEWSASLVDHVGELVTALEKGDETTAIKRLASVAYKIHGTDLSHLEALPGELADYLHHIGANADGTQGIVDFAKANLDKIAPMLRA